jgi:hypothetical protein
MLVTAAGLAPAIGTSPEIVLGTGGLPPVPPLPTDQVAEPTTQPFTEPAAQPLAVDGAAPMETVQPPVVIDVEPSPHMVPAGPRHDEPELPPIVRPRYGSVLTNGAYMPVPIPPRPAGTASWLPGGREGRVGSPYYYSAPGQDGPLYVVHGGRGVPWGYNHSVFEYHFGPGFYRDGEAGHYRFPYYTYRAPWYSPGPPIYNRFTNRPW